MTTRELTDREKSLQAMTAQAYVDEQNAQARARAEANGGTLIGTLVCSEDWKTGLDAARCLAIGEHSDAYKEANGVRPRHVNYSELSLDEIEARIQAIHDDFEPEPEDDFDYDDPMDGDHESALASAGFGTDEDYGYYGGDEDW